MDTGDTPSGGAAAESGTARPGLAGSGRPRQRHPLRPAEVGSRHDQGTGQRPHRLAGVAAAALAVLAGMWGRKPTAVLALAVAAVLAGAVLAAVQHAEVVAHRVGEPFG